MEFQSPEEKIGLLMDRSIDQVHRLSFSIKDTSADLKYNGFHGGQMGSLRRDAELLLKAIHEYQAYANACLAFDSEEV